MERSLFKDWLHYRHNRFQARNGGFTLLESLVVVVMVGILAAIAAPGWLGYMNRRRVVTTRDDIYQAVLQAQTKAKQRSVAHEVSFRLSPNPDTLNFLEWSVHPSGVTGTSWETAQSSIVAIDTACPDAVNPLANTFEFDFKGNLTDNSLRTLYVVNARDSAPGGAPAPTLRAVHIQTLIGAIRKVDQQCL